MEKNISWWQRIIPPLTLASVTAFIYSFSLNYDFQFDDIANIRAFFGIRHEGFWQHAFKSPRWISYWLNTQYYQLGQFDPFYYRGFNILFHIGTGLLIFYLLKKAFSFLPHKNYYYQNGSIISFVTALLFLLHPVQTQTVSYVIQGQLEGLAGFMVMATLLTFLHLTQAKTLLKRAVLTFLFFALGFISCGTKEIAILSPVMALLLDWFFVARGDLQKLKSRWLLHLTFFGLISSTYIYYLKPAFFKNAFTANMVLDNNIGNVITNHPADRITPLGFFISQFKVILHYIYIFIWPFALSVDYDWKLVDSFLSPECLAPLFLILLLLTTILWLLKRNKTSVIAFGALWFFIGLAPRSTFIPSTELLADYKTYFSSFGGLLLVGIMLVKLFEWIKEQIKYTSCPSLIHHPYTAFCFFVLLLGGATYQRNLVWKNQEAFWLDVLAHSPLKARAHNNYGTALAQKGDHKNALLAFKKATKLDAYYPDPWNNLAVTYEKLGNVDRAIETMEQALKMHDEYPEFYNNLGAFYLTKKEYDKVEPWCRKAIKLRPHYGKAFYNIGRAKFEQGKTQEAWDLFYTACFKADYDIPLGFEALGKASVKLQRFDDAILAFERALQQIPKQTPDYIDTLFNLANAHYCKGNLDKAEQYYLAMTQINPDDLRSYFNLGELYLKTKGATAALPYFERAAPLAQHIPQVGTRIAECKNMTQKEQLS